MTGVGRHEVIIESPQHLTSTSQLSDEQAARLFCAYRDRLVDLGQDRRLAYGLVFKNAGPPAGATLAHTHSQLLATPVLPFNVSEELVAARRWFDEHGGCLFCEMIRTELAGRTRVLEESDDLVAFCPFAGRFPYETWILPKCHASPFRTGRCRLVGKTRSTGEARRGRDGIRCFAVRLQLPDPYRSL